MIIGIIFLFGLCVGSFLNVVIDRLPRGESIFIGRSHCDICLHKLAWYDLIPLLSFLLTRGTCRYCGKFFGFKYPLIEIVTTFLLTYVWSMYGSIYLFWADISLLFLVSGFIIIFFADLFYGIIPDSVVSVLLITSSLYLVVSSGLTIQHIIAGLLSGLFFLIIFSTTKGKGMGFGDVKYAVVMGFFLGFPKSIVALYVAFLTGAIVSLILIVFHRKKFHGGTIAFGPFLVLGTLVSWLCGDTLWRVITNLLHI